MAKYEPKQELEEESKYYLICPKCRNEHLHHYYLNDKEKWTEEKIKALGFQEKAFIRLCLLPDSQFSCVIQFCC